MTGIEAGLYFRRLGLVVELTRGRLSAAEIAVHLDVAPRTVVRYRERARVLGRLP